MLNMDILTSYSFIIVGSGTFLLAAALQPLCSFRS